MNEFKNISAVSGSLPAPIMQGQAMQQIKTAYTTAVAVQKPRSLPEVLNKVLDEAKSAGADFYYRWTLKGGKKVEGGSIGLAMAIARNYRNLAIETSMEETMTHWVFRASFIDLENGFTTERLFQQRKNQSLSNKMDADRQADIAFQIGQSKAIRNVVLHSAPTWIINKAIAAAQKAELAGIGENLQESIAKAISFFEGHGIEIERMEAKIKKPSSKWIATDIEELRANASAVNEGRVSVHDIFPEIKPEAGAKAASIPETNGKEKPDTKDSQKKNAPPAGNDEAGPGVFDDDMEADRLAMIETIEKQPPAKVNAALKSLKLGDSFELKTADFDLVREIYEKVK